MASDKTKDMSFLDHLEEFRWLLVRSALAIIIGSAVAFFFTQYIFDSIIFGPKDPNFITYHWFCELSNFVGFGDTFCVKEIPIRIQSREMSGQFSAHIWMAITVGIILTFPFLLWEFWKFVSPALYQKEKKYAVGFLIATSLLFFTGVLFGYYIVCPMSINFLSNYSVSKEVFNDIDLNSYITLIKTASIACGLLFELPIIIFFLTKMGLVDSAFLRKARKYVIVIILILAGLITPPDAISQIIVSIPLVILYEISIIISRFVEKKKIN
jgi:sec-independent protein translocase protein TatC